MLLNQRCQDIDCRPRTGRLPHIRKILQAGNGKRYTCPTACQVLRPAPENFKNLQDQAVSNAADSLHETRQQASKICKTLNEQSRRSILGAAAILLSTTSPAGAVKQVMLNDGTAVTVYEHGISLNIVALRGAVPNQWLMEYQQLLSRYAGYGFGQRAQLQEIFDELAAPEPRKAESAANADVVSLGDAWLAPAIQRGLLQPIPDAESSRWWQRLPPRWQRMVRRGPDGGVSPHGRVYGCPFRWGSTVVAFRKDLLLHYGGHGIRDWVDLLQPKLRGRVAFMDSSREFVGIALKSLGLSLNTRASDLQRHGLTLQQVKDRVQAFRQQARLFSDRESGRALGAGDVWAMVGSSGDVLPLAERMQSVAVVVPVSGTALWADVWVVPRGAKGGSNMAGPSPLLPSWLEFTTMPARIGTIPGLKEGASPLLLPDLEISEPLHNIDEHGEWEGMALAKGNGYLPASTVLARSEFLCPLDHDTVALYHQLLSNP